MDPDGSSGQSQIAPDGTHTIGYIKYLDLPYNEQWIARRVAGIWQSELISSAVGGGIKVGFRYGPGGRPAMAVLGEGIRFSEERP